MSSTADEMSIYQPLLGGGLSLRIAEPVARRL